MAAVDWTDPCAKATALREAYFNLVSGERESRFRIRNGEHERDVTYAAVNIELLARELRQAEADCAVKNGTAGGRRYAIRGGALRTPRWPFGGGGCP